MENNTAIFEEFARRAARKLEERKKQRTETLHIGSIDMDIEIRGLSDKEFMECSEFSENSLESDRYTIFYASKTLQSAAQVLVAQGTLKSGEEYQITNMFSIAERRYIVEHIIHLTGVYEKAEISVIQENKEIKNS